MEEKNNDYHISFFKPTTAHAKSNRNIVIWFVLVWAIAIFGFHIALRILEKPTPESTFLKFENVWPQVKSDQATVADLQDFSYSALSVIGKNFIKEEYKTALNNGISWSVIQLADSVQKEEILSWIKEFESIAADISDINNQEYVDTKGKLIDMVSPLLGLETNDVRNTLIPLTLVSTMTDSFTDENKVLVEEAMSLYLIHNQSVLTDTKFLGFPFHYFYTAIFLLVLFVGLCWLYCVRIDQINTKLNIIE